MDHVIGIVLEQVRLDHGDRRCKGSHQAGKSTQRLSNVEFTLRWRTNESSAGALMMITAFVALYVAATSCLETVEIPVLHQRASRVLAKLDPSNFPGVELAADDIRGVIVANGSEDSIQMASTYIRVYDVLRRRIHLDVSVDSILDKLTFESSATVSNDEQWKTTESDIGIAVNIRPLINDDNTLSLLIELSSKTLKQVPGTVRVKNKEKAAFSVGNRKVQVIDSNLPGIKQTSKLNPYDPKVNVTATIIE